MDNTEKNTIQINMKKSNSNKLYFLIRDLISKNISKVSHSVKLNKVLSDTI
jgi:hypothetical protein